MGGTWRADPNASTIREFLKLLAVCHTVLPEGNPTPAAIKYQVHLATLIYKSYQPMRQR